MVKNETAVSRNDAPTGKDDLREARRAAELYLLSKIASSTGSQARDFAEAYALLTGRYLPPGKKQTPVSS
ncbi:hypothetical protein [Arthrobacter pityocampae]|uniref:hypothetical protein n=1 Tax=Arthrobacter pityocampae TaxID=547334 RepID=UPI0037355B12